MKKPTIVLVHGGFATVSCFEALCQQLVARGYRCEVAAIPSVDAERHAPKEATCLQDIQAIREKTLAPLIETEGEEVVIFAHSYGGIVGGAAACGLSRASRTASGLHGGVLGLIYLAGNITLEGQSLVEGAGGLWPPFIKADQPEPGFCVMDPVIDTLFNDIDDKSQLKELEASHTPHRTSAFTTPASRPAWLEAADNGALAGRIVYIRTLRDHVFPTFVQDAFIEASGVHWDVVDIDAGHSAYASQPETVATIVDRFASTWAADA